MGEAPNIRHGSAALTAAARARGNPPNTGESIRFHGNTFQVHFNPIPLRSGEVRDCGLGARPRLFGDEDPAHPLFHRVLSQVIYFLNPTPVCASQKYFRDASGADPADEPEPEREPGLSGPPPHTPSPPDHPQGRRGSASVGSALDSSFRGGKDWVPCDRAGRRAKLAPSRRLAGPGRPAARKKGKKHKMGK